MKKLLNFCYFIGLIIGFIFLLTANQVMATIYCVANEANLIAAINDAENNGLDDVIKIQQGTYNGNFVYVSSESYDLAIEGGYTALCARRNVDPTNTILDGGETGGVLALSAPNLAADFIVDGLTFQNGSSTDRSGGISAVTKGTVTLTNNIISNNFGGNEEVNISGGVFISDSSTVTLTNNTISHNECWEGTSGGVEISDSRIVILTNNAIRNNTGGGEYSFVGGIGVSNSNTVTLTNNNISNNYNNRYIGGVSISNSNTVTLTSNIISNNDTFDSICGGIAIGGSSTVTLANNIINNNHGDDAKTGGVLVTDSSAVTMTNNIISNNTNKLGDSGGISVHVSGSITLNNNTISKNSNRFRGRSGGVYLRLISDSTIANINNNIMWNNAIEEPIDEPAADLRIENDWNDNGIPSTVNLYNNDFDQSSEGTYIQIPFSIDPSNLNNEDPRFVDPDNDDFHLSEISPCKDAGMDSGVYVDIDGDARPQGLGFDIGADEIVVVDSLLYRPVSPCRIVDTRRSGGIIGAFTQRNFHVYGSGGTISAQGGNPYGCSSPLGEPLAAHINMVAVNPTGKGNLQAFPVGARTGAGLSVNYNTIDTNLANAGNVKTSAGAIADITVASNFSSAHTVIDVLGYYYPDKGFYYTPVDPCRIVDTRKTIAGIINANTERDFRASGPVADQGGNPAGCPSTLTVSPEAAHLNMVAVNPTGKGNLQAFPAGARVGAGLSVNYNTIDTNLADAGTVKTSPDITVASNFSSAHTVIDVLGYYSEEEDLLYTPVIPCRIVDTRKTAAGIIDANTQRDFRVFGSVRVQGGSSSGCSAPMGEPLAAHINMIAVNPTGKGNLQAFPVGARIGTGLSVNYNTIDTNLANAGTVKTAPRSAADISVASNFSSAHAVIDVLGFYYPAP